MSNMTEPPKVKVEYVLFDMDGLLLNTFSNSFLTHMFRSADRLGEDLHDRDKYVDRLSRQIYIYV